MLPVFALMFVIELGERLPAMKGEFLTGRAATLPGVAAGKVAFVAVGFSYQSRFAVEAWMKRFRADFGREARVTFFEVPMIGGMAVMGKWFIDSGMRRGTPKEDQEHVITVYGGVGDWKKRLGFGAADAGYLLLLDTEGRVAWKFTGTAAVDEHSYGDLSGKVRSLVR